MFICTYALHTASYACFLIQIHRYTWFTVVPLISLVLLVISCTCMPGLYHLIMYTCACYARHLALLYVLARLHLTTQNSHVQILEPGLWWPYCADQSAQRILPWRSGRNRSLDIVVTFPPSSSPDWLSRPLLLLVSTLLAQRPSTLVLMMINSCSYVY